MTSPFLITFYACGYWMYFTRDHNLIGIPRQIWRKVVKNETLTVIKVGQKLDDFKCFGNIPGYLHKQTDRKQINKPNMYTNKRKNANEVKT